MVLKLYKSIFILLFCSLGSFAQVWQWSYTLKNSREHKGDATAFLWIPENCRQLKAVIIAQNNMEEQSILQSPSFRKGLAELGVAEIWVSPMFDHSFLFNKGSGDTFNEFMDSLAVKSGYQELKVIPFAAMGHSAAASWPYYLAAWNPQRALACLSISGQWPYFRDKNFAPDIWGTNQNLDYIPCLETMGEYESAESWSAEGLKERTQHPLLPLSMLASPAQGHFATTDKKNDYILFYLKKAMQYRLPKKVAIDRITHLKPVDPTQTGWLADRWRVNQFPRAKASPVKEYKGNPADAFWFFDEETAKVTERYEAEYRNLKPLLLGFVQEGKVLPQHNSHLQVDLKFKPSSDGISFQVGGAFMDTVGGGSPRLTQWTKMPVGSVIGHPADTNGIVINKVVGPFKKIGRNTFQLSLERGLGSPTSYSLTFTATHPGDEEFKPAVQQGSMQIPASLSDGRPQEITFTKLRDIKSSTKKIHLAATCSSGMPVYFYVNEGPAEVKGDDLYLTKIPPCSKMPMKVTVVAWQYGRSLEPKIASAKPVLQSFYIIP